MKAIWKFPLSMIDSQSILMPEGAQVLAVQVQGGVPCLWALVDTEAPQVSQTVRIHGTGHRCDDTLDRHNYLGTFQLERGALVFHVFGWIN